MLDIGCAAGVGRRNTTIMPGNEMGLSPRILASLVIFAVAVPSATLAFDGPTQVQGGSKKSSSSPSAKTDGASKAPEKKKASKGTKQLDGGKKAYQAGDTKRAIKLFNGAMASKELTSKEIAQALYYRGLAYNKLKMPGRAIADMTGALWMKGGLSSTERAQALKVRDASYRSAGISNPPGASQSKRAVPSPAVDGISGDAFSGWETATKDITVPSTTSAASAAPKPTTTSTPAAPTLTAGPTSTPTASSSSSSSGGGISGFFSNVTNFFTGSASSEQASSGSSAPVTTSATSAAPVEASSWSQSTQVSKASPPAAAKPAQVTTPFETKVATAPARAPAGIYRLQVASVRTRSEANSVAAQFVSKYGSRLGSRRPVVDEAVEGSTGTVYHVTVGPYASAGEPQKLCGSIRAGGFDCLVVTR